jgi:hypothetical protein
LVQVQDEEHKGSQIASLFCYHTYHKRIRAAQFENLGKLVKNLIFGA